MIYQKDLDLKSFQLLLEADRVAWDIETTGLDPMHDRIGTCQLSSAATGVVIVQVTSGIPARLKEVLESSRVQKVFHHAPFDLGFMSIQWQAVPANIFCTKIASKILRPTAKPHQYSLQYLLKSRLNITISKGDVRTSDWQSLDLSSEQIDYASKDVIYLAELAEVLQQDLRESELTNEALISYNFLCLQMGRRARKFSDLFEY